jgi:hypothetical protein
VHDTIVEGFNCAGQQGVADDLGRFQGLIAAGVEDAIVEGLNRTTVADPQAAPCKKAAGSANFPAGSKKTPLAEPHKASVPPPPPPPTVGEKAMPAKDLRSPPRRTARGPVAAPVSWPHSPLREVSTLGPQRLSFAESEAVRRHYAGSDDAQAFSARYSDSRLITSGWIVQTSGIVPLSGNREFLILSLREDSEHVEIWSRGVLIAEKCRYVRYFEDAKPLRKPF